MCVTNIAKRRSAAVANGNGATNVTPSLLSQRLMGNFMPLMMNNTTIPKPVASSSNPTQTGFAPNQDVLSRETLSSFYQGVPSACSFYQGVPSACSFGTHGTGEKRRPRRRRKPQKPGKTAKQNERHFVVHNYHDHAFDPDENDEVHEEDGSGRRRGGVALSFPTKLHKILDQVEADGLGHVISWQPHGRCFVIHKPKEFSEHVMPHYFRQSKLTSFQRQLNLYGFSRITRGQDSGGYYHELFLRGKVFLTKRMQRTKIKGTKFKAASSPDQEPNFYAMSPVGQGFPQVISDDSSVDESTNTGLLWGSSEQLNQDTQMSASTFDPLPLNVPTNPQVPNLTPYPLLNTMSVTSNNFVQSAGAQNMFAPSMNPMVQKKNVVADEILDEAVEELFRETNTNINSDVMNAGGNFDDIWDGAEFGEESYEDDLQLGFMLEKIMDE